MRKYYTLGAVIGWLVGAASIGVAQPAAEHSIFVFGERLSFPGVCTVWARPSVLDGATQITCDLEPGRPEVLHVYLRPSDRCRPGSLVGEGNTVRYETERNARLYTEVIGAGDTIVRVVADAEVCLVAVSSSAKALDSFLRPVWF